MRFWEWRGVNSNRFWKTLEGQRMKKKGLKSIILLLAVALGLRTAALLPKLQALSAVKAAVTSESIKEKEQQISNAKKEKKELQESLSNIKKLKESLESQKSDLKKYVSELDGNLEKLEQNISQLKEQIAGKEEEITQTQEELLAAQQKAEEQYEAMKIRIRFMYETTNAVSVLEMLFNAESISALLNNADYVNSIYDYDQKMWEEYQENCAYIELCKEQLGLEKEILAEQKAGVEESAAQVESLIAEKQKQITSYETDIQTKEQAIKEYEQDIAAQNELIAQMEKAVEEEKKKLQQSQLPTYDGGAFKFPLATYTRISDNYGNRIHPTLGVQQFHNGVDFAAPSGTAIYAAYDGTVVAAAYNATMGNYVMINHGDGLYTIYMHASALYVSSGAKVSRGDTIAAVGSTGRSTGNHLHFSVRLNGSYVSPWNYLSQ